MNDLLKKLVCTIIAVIMFFCGNTGIVSVALEKNGDGEEGAVTVKHTEKWEQNRAAYNLRCSGNRARGENEFWPGEKIIVCFSPADNVDTVTAYIEGNSGSVCNLRLDTDGMYIGELRDSSENSRWTAKSENRNIVVEAGYSDGTVKRLSRIIVVDGTDLFWKIHRIY